MRRINPTAAVLALALSGAAALVDTPAAAAQPPLSPKNYGVGALCSAPAPGRAACFGLALVARAPLSLPGARALAAPVGASRAVPSTEFKTPLGGLTPAQLRAAYGLAEVPAPSPTQTIAIVDAYDDPTAEADLATFSTQFGLPSCTEAEGCFRKVNEEGQASPLPAWKGRSEERGWAMEIATDIDTSHAVCPSCHILLVEANGPSDLDLFAAENSAAGRGANEISNSWGGSEPPHDNAAFDHPGIAITASSGDSGYLNWLSASGHYANYPASSPHVVAVGGTRLLQSEGTWSAESVWNDGGEQEGLKTGDGASGGGCSAVFTAPLWQQGLSDWAAVACAGRAVADIAADGDPYTGVDVYDSTTNPQGNKGWAILGGTSVASPIIASIFALAGGAHGVQYPARTLYENAAGAPAGLHDVSAGSNGECTHPFNQATGTSGCTSAEEAASCSASAICLAGSGYDGPSGVGTPNGIGAFEPTGREGGVLGGGGAPEKREQGPGPGGAAAASSGNGGLPPAPTPAAPATPTVSALALTRSALIALNRAHPKVSRVGFSFVLSVPTRVTASLARWARVHRHRRWKRAALALVFTAAAGRQSVHFAGRGGLPPGEYRLTVSPPQGSPAAIVFQIG